MNTVELATTGLQTSCRNAKKAVYIHYYATWGIWPHLVAHIVVRRKELVRLCPVGKYISGERTRWERRLPKEARKPRERGE